MDSKKHVFSESGPNHLTSVDWNNVHHRRAVIASLVKGTSVLERDRMDRREGPEAFALPWFEFFSFRLEHKFVDANDGNIFGAIYSYTSRPVQNAPSYVVAFRGMIIEPDSLLRDIKHGVMCIINTLHRGSCFTEEMQKVRDLVETAGAPKVWLTGHSLGSAVAMLVGKDMARAGIRLETYLFNPLFLSLPVERIRVSKLRFGIHFTRSLVKAGLVVSLKALDGRAPKDDHFSALSSWVPYLFVNPNDDLCSGYIGYFEHRTEMEAIGAGRIEAIATQNSVRSLVSGAFGSEVKPLYPLPSADLTINQTPSSNLKQAHGIRQWWDHGNRLRSVMYQL